MSSNLLCKSLNIQYPIIQAPMSGVTTPELVAAASNAGGLGILGAGRMLPNQILDAIHKIKKLTNHTYGVNLLLAPDTKEVEKEDIFNVQQFLDNKFRQNLGLSPKSNQGITLPSSILLEQLRVIVDEKVPLVSFAMGDPVKHVEQIHSIGAKVMSMVTTVEEAINVVRNGTDIVVVQGAEAGGHRSTFDTNPDEEEIPLIGTMALVPQVVDAIKKEGRSSENIPVVAAGGIADGRGLAAVLALGASGVMLGTRFLVANESGAFKAYQERLLSSKETDTVVTKIFTGRPARGLRNSFVHEYLKSGSKPLAWPIQSLAANDIYAAAQQQNNAEYFPLLAGQGLRMLKKGQSAAEIIQEIMSEAKQRSSILNEMLIAG
ncbi:MAG: nitronate monooxygenase [Candidatus Nitrosopolaris sp.]